MDYLTGSQGRRSPTFIEESPFPKDGPFRFFFLNLFPSLDPKQRIKNRNGTLITGVQGLDPVGGDEGKKEKIKIKIKEVRGEGTYRVQTVTTPVSSLYRGGNTGLPSPRIELAGPAVPDPTVWMKCDSCALERK